MSFKSSLKMLLTVAVVSLGSGGAMANTAGVFPQNDVLNYLEHVVQWQREASVIEPANHAPRELMFQDTVRQNALRGLRAGFKFARAQASIAPAEMLTENGEANPAQRMVQHGRENDKNIAQLQAQLRGKISAAQRQQLEDKLKLALAQQDLLETVQANFNAAASGGGASFSAKIGNLQRGIPAMLSDADPAEAQDHSAAAPLVALSNSLFGLSAQLFELARKQRELQAFMANTDAVETVGRDMLASLRTTLDDITTSQTATADARVADFKQVSTVVAPLAEANVWISTSKTALKDWNETLGNQFTSVLKQFAVALGLLLAMLAVPLVLSEVAARMIARYVSDSKRQRQANMARRIMVGVAVVFVLLLHFISDFSSVVTFAGFITAGLAVALQGVLLSLVAHFLFYGRYGVRAGDRVNVAGVTGDIVQIGMVRFYLRELHSNAEGVLEPTGKVVAFPNSILFQPSAFYKYVG